MLKNKRIIFDIDDAIFLSDVEDGNILNKVKAFVKSMEVRGMLKISDAVIVENEYIRSFAAGFCTDIHKIPGPIDTDRYAVRPALGREKIVIGWIGSPATTLYLRLLDSVFADILARFKQVEIVLIGAGNYEFNDPRVIKKEWKYDTEVNDLQDFDIGIMPMPDNKWTRGKLGCKMLQYMAVGIPSVVSYTDTNAELINHGGNGFLVTTENDWIETLSLLVAKPEIRMRIGAEGRKTVERLCSVEVNGPTLLSVLVSQT